MRIGPKYKIARRLRAPIFAKTQTQKFTIAESRKVSGRRRGRRGVATDYGSQLIEKQKLRLSYGLSERQFRRYIDRALESRGQSSTSALTRLLESRLDNIVYRLGLAPTRQMARQLVSHRHITVNGRVVNIPSYNVEVGDRIGIREGSRNKGIWAALPERLKEMSVPAWLSLDQRKVEGEVEALPGVPTEQLHSNVEAVLDFYRR